MLILMLMAFVAWLLPASELASLTYEFFDVLRSSFGFSIACLIVSNAGWIYLNRRQREIYSREIDRLSEIRSRLIHGKFEAKVLEEHSSSVGHQQESYIVPSSAMEYRKTD